MRPDTVLTPVPNCGQHSSRQDVKKQVFLSILSFLWLHLVTSRPVFGSFRCLWSVLHSYISQTTPEFVWKWTETHLFSGLVHTRCRMAAFTLIHMNSTNRVCFKGVMNCIILLFYNVSWGALVCFLHQKLS